MIVYRCKKCCENHLKKWGYCYLLFKKSESGQPRTCPWGSGTTPEWEKTNQIWKRVKVDVKK